MIRPDIDVYMLGMALMAATRATCSRRSVGCILTNRLNHIMATGYNGVPRGIQHCGIEICPALNAASGTSLDGCMATHAEQNALLQCRNVEEIETAYVTASPCLTCTKLLMNTACKRIVFIEEYPHPAAGDLWRSRGGIWDQATRQMNLGVEEMFRRLADKSVINHPVKKEPVSWPASRL